MFLTVKRLALFLTFLAQAVAQVPSIGGGSSGGASAINDLTDVTITSGADGDGLRNNGSAWVNTALFDAATTDFRADRMSTNVRTAVGAGLTNGRVPYISGGVLVVDEDLRFDGSNVTIGGGGGGMTSAYQLNFGISGARASIYGEQSGGSSLRFTVNNGKQFFQIGGAQTALVQDQTAMTGDTSFAIKLGAGQSANPFEIKTATAGERVLYVDSKGTDAAPYAFISTYTGRMDFGNLWGIAIGGSILRGAANSNGLCWNSLNSNLNDGFDDICVKRSEAGVLKVTDGSTGYGALDSGSYRLSGSGAVIHPPSATEPVDCTTSNDGSMYFDTTDQTMCVCANDGVDEWQKITDMATDCSI